MERTIPDLLDFEVREAGSLRYSGGPEWISREFDFDQADADEILQRILEHPLAKGQIQNMTRIQDTHYQNLQILRTHVAELVDSL